MNRFSAALVFLASFAAAQRWDSPGNTSKVSVPDEQGREPLELIAKSAAQGEFDRALDLLQGLLDRYPEKVVESVRAQRSPSETDHIVPGDIYVGLRTAVMERILALPDGLLRYRTREDGAAAKGLAAGIASRDEAQLRRVMTSRWLTTSGPAAASALADLLFEDGRPEESAAVAHAAIRDAMPDLDLRLKAQLGARLLVALSCFNSGNALAGVRKELGALTIEVDGSAISLEALADRLKPSVAASDLPTVPTLTPFSSKPLFARGLKVQETRDSFDGGDYFRSFGQDIVGAGLIFAPVYPEIVEGVAYWCDGLTLNAVNLITGENAWPPVEGPFGAFEGRRNWNLSHGVTYDRGVVFTSLEDEPSIRRDGRGTPFGYTPIETIPSRKLVAVDASTGDTIWSHLGGGSSDLPSEDRDFLRRITVNSVPLVSGERVYVGVTYYVGGFRHWLCAFDRTTGRLVWKTYVARGQAEQNMFGRPVKEAVPSQVGLHRGTLVYSTNIGVVTGIDAATGVTRWVSSYSQDLIPVTEGQRTIERFPGWVAGRPSFFENFAFVAPTDALWAYAVNMNDGKLTPIEDEAREERMARTKQNQFRHFLGVHDGLAIASGRWLTAFDITGLAEGKPIVFKWKAGGIGGNDPLGRPSITNGRITWLSLSSGGANGPPRTKVIIADIRSGKALDERRLDPPAMPGNLVLTDEAAIIAGTSSITAWFDAGPVATRLDARLTANPKDSEAALRRGQLALAQRRPDLAVSLLERATTSIDARVAKEASSSLLTLWLDLAKSGVPIEGVTLSPSDRFSKAVSFAVTPRQKAMVRKDELLASRRGVDVALIRRAARALLALNNEPIRVDAQAVEIVAMLSAGSDLPASLYGALIGATLLEGPAPTDSISFYQEILARHPDTSLGGSTGTTGFQFAYDRIRSLIEQHGPKVYSDEEAAAKKALEAATASRDPDAIAAVVNRYPNAAIAGEAQATLTQALRDAKRDRDVLRIIQRQMRRLGQVDALTAIEMARSFIAAGRGEAALDVLDAIGARFPEGRIGAGALQESVPQVIASLRATPAVTAVSSPAAPKNIRPGLKEGWVAMSNKDGELPYLLSPTGRDPASATPFVYAFIDGELRAIDEASGVLRWKRVAKNGLLAPPAWYEGKLIVAADEDVVALEAASGSVEWQSSIDGKRLVAMDASHGKIWLLLRDARNPRSALLRALDAASGELVSETRLPGGTSDTASFGAAAITHSRLWILVRLDSAGSAYVIDALTGDVAAPAIPVGRSGSPFPALSSSDLVVTQTGGGQGRSIRLTGRDVLKQEDVWQWKGDRLEDLTVLEQSQSAVVLASQSRTVEAIPKRRRDILLLNLNTGIVAPSIPLATAEVPKDASLTDNLILVRLAVTSESGPQPTFVRAYQRSNGVRAWESIPETGSSLRVTLHVAKDFLLLRSSSLDETDGRRSGGRTDRFRLIELANGLLKDEWSVRGDENLPDGIDTELRNGAVVIVTGGGVTIRR